VGRLLREQLQALGLKHPTLDDAAMGQLKAAMAALKAEKK
jgi:hypothetical protein